MRLSPGFFSLSIPITLAVVLAACGGSDSSDNTGAPVQPGPGSAAPLRDAVDPAIVSTLKDVGLELDKLPADLETIADAPDHKQLQAVMKTFTLALGVQCEGCHVSTAGKLDYEAESPQKNVAKRMWKDFVLGLKRTDGKPIFCDTCHQGKKEFLDRSNEEALRTWMDDNFVAKLTRTDGKQQNCAACHGAPFNGDFLADWEK
jgi:hypothetical protein